MPTLLVVVGVVLVLVVWAIVASSSRKAEVRTDPMAPTQMPALEPERELPKAKSWQEARTASVSKNFGRGGAPTGISKDVGTASAQLDDDMERLKKAKAFEPRATAVSLKSDDE